VLPLPFKKKYIMGRCMVKANLEMSAYNLFDKILSQFVLSS
jgi:hypothetical protein